jgi:hypothetical protein
MFLTGLLVGIFIGANIGVVVAGLLGALNRDSAIEESGAVPAEYVVMEGFDEPDDHPQEPDGPLTYLDRYPYA